MARVLNGRTPKEYAEFVGNYVRLHRGLDLYHDGEDADHLCDGIKEIMDERDALRIELALVKFNLKLLFNIDYESMEWNACYDRLMDYIDNDNFAALAPKETDR